MMTWFFGRTGRSIGHSLSDISQLPGRLEHLHGFMNHTWQGGVNQ